MKVIHNPHDHFFRSAMTNLKVAKEFFQYHLPEKVQAYLNLDTLALQPGTYINEALEDSASDVLYKVNYRDKSDWAYLYLLVDHQSSVDYLIAFRLWQYVFSIWGELIKKHGNKSRTKTYKLPLVIPLLFYNGSEKYTGTRDIRELIAAPQSLIDAVFVKPIPLIDLHDTEDEELREHQRAKIMQFCMKHVYAKEILNYIQHILESARFIWHDGEHDLAIAILNYILSQGRTADPEHLIKVLKIGLEEEGEMMGNLVDYLTQKNKDIWLQSGIQQGIEQGIQRGKQEGESTLIIHQLKRKFKAIPKRYLNQVIQADQEDLLKWADRILESESLEEIFRD